jgi:phenylacetate-CoA ligase
VHWLKHWLHRRQRPARYAQLASLLATQAMTRTQVLRKQQDDLRAIINFATENTAYYRGRFGMISDSFDFATLPILRKDDVRQHMADMLARDADPHTTPIGHTGGSTGNPLAFYYNDAKHELMRAGMMRSYMMSGWRPGEKILNFWGARLDTMAGGIFGGTRWGDFVAAETTLPAQEVSDVKLHAWADFLQRYHPVLLQGYATILAALARFVLEQRLAVPASLIGVYSTAEVLDDGQRTLIEQAFGCKVFNQYGSREIPNIACECRHGNMHVFTDMVYLESIDDNLIVTSLTNRLMPMIRYENGDSGRLKEGECACGSPFPLMEMGMCRQNDLIRTPGGKRIHPSYFNRLLAGRPEVGQFQIIQEVPERLTLNVVTDSASFAPAVLAALQEAIRRDLDERMVLELNTVAEIERTASGKHRFVISHVS